MEDLPDPLQCGLEILARLQGKWAAGDMSDIEVIGMECLASENGPDRVSMVLEPKTFPMMLNGWELLGFDSRDEFAYWRKGDEIVHWVRGLN